MSTKIRTAEIVSVISLRDIPDGIYPGIWGGYFATATINGEQVRFQTVDGIRTTNAPCLVVASGGEVTVEATNNAR